MRPVIAFLGACLITVGCTNGEDISPDPITDPVFVDAAYQICPMMWQWQLSVGAVMNDMSRAARVETDAGRRLELYMVAMEEARALVSTLREQVASLSDFTAAFVVDIRSGLDRANVEIDNAERFVLESYDVGAPGYSDIVPPVFMSFEKVIDLAKPEMATYNDPKVLPSFREIPQCQFGVKDVDDGVPRYVPLTPEPTVPTASG